MESIPTLALLTAMAIAYAAAADCNCASALLTVDPVCYNGQITLQNSCVASCQDLANSLITAGACKASSKYASYFSRAETPTSRDVLLRFRSKGYLYAGSLVFATKQGLPSLGDGLYTSTPRPAPPPPPPLHDDDVGIRLMADGSVYAQFSSSYFSVPTSGVDLNTVSGKRRSGARRSLLAVIGPEDTREVLTSPKGWEAVGLLGSDTASWLCTATAIGPTTIITAAHCVYEPTVGFYGNDMNFKLQDGVWIPASYISMFKRWADNMDYSFDIAVIELSKPLSVPYASYGYSTRSCPGYSSAPTIGGYAADRKYQLVKTTCPLVTHPSCMDSSEVPNFCDVTLGMWGGPVWDSLPEGAMLTGVMSHDVVDRAATNYFASINQQSFKAIYEWKWNK